MGMHEHEQAIDESMVRGLLADQFPDWAERALEPVPSAGTDNALYRLGEDLCVRLPRIPEATGQAEKEHRWLPRLAPALPLEIPLPVARGVPGHGYPWSWSIYRWLEGEDAVRSPVADDVAAARQLADFIRALQSLDASGAPAPGQHNFFRGTPLAWRDRHVREAIDALADELDVDAATGEWERALAAPVWPGPPVWVHGDLHAGNLLTREGRLAAVIDFGGLAAGDPACELIVAWDYLGAVRDDFRKALPVDDATWARGRGWALSVALIALPYYRETNPSIVAASWRTIRAVLEG